MSRNNLPVLSVIKYGAVAFAFIFGYEFAGTKLQPYIAIAGWILGFIVGLKLQVKYANRS